MGGGGIAPVSSPSPASGSPTNSRATSAVAAVSVALILLYLFWRFVWQSKKHASSTAPPPEACGRSVDAERGENGRPPLPVFVHVATPAAGGAEEKAECAVCLVEFAHGEAGRLVPGCGHGFHAACIEPWLRVRSTCPLCRAAVVEEEERSAGPAPRLEHS
ncbi:hypothetical protein QYE76_068013 [Lolium multiflorum]|uniref:RING-type E3 ubiquitin transferase n=1 Tax=Lolium multiflorum TaxID=4521 RepID=A0AAD8WBI9_LOLMU|nr:hypothetical protein QYE76_068013 [Lolium multiflorum]